MFRYLVVGFVIALIALFLFPAITSARGPYLVLKMENKPVLPGNFRMSTTPFPKKTPNPPSRLGLDELNESGSGQFSQKSLRKVFETIPNWNITVVDLREEPHGFLNGMAITWYTDRNWLNAGLTMEEIETDQQKRLERLLQLPMVFVYKDKRIPFPVFVRTVASEMELVGKVGMNYIRYPARDHIRPTDETVDEFIEFFKTLTDDDWLHFHCSAGKGRTTTFMTMYDMMHNAHQVNMEDIIRRQYLIGGLNLLAAPSPSDWKYPYALKRSKFIQNFYRYCIDHPDFKISWTEWLALQKKGKELA